MADDFSYSAGKITVCNGTSGTPLTFADMHDANVAGGWGVITEIVENGSYKIDCNIDFGDGTESTYFRSSNELIYFTDGKSFTIKNNATLQIGKKQGDWGYAGAAWSIGPSAHLEIIGSAITTAVFKCYASSFHARTSYLVRLRSGTIEVLNSTLSSTRSVVSSSNKYYLFEAGIVSLILKKVFFNDAYGIGLRKSGATYEDVHVHYCKYGLALHDGSASVAGALLSGIVEKEVRITGGTGIGATLTDTEQPVSSVEITTGETNYILEKYSCNVHVSDEDGAGISGVAVDCQDKDDNYVWTQGSVTTDAGGDISEQTITYKRWLGVSEALTTYSPHKFTISAAGYDDLVIDNVTVNELIKWHIELQKPRSRPRIGLAGEPIAGAF